MTQPQRVKRLLDVGELSQILSNPSPLCSGAPYKTKACALHTSNVFTSGTKNVVL